VCGVTDGRYFDSANLRDNLHFILYSTNQISTHVKPYKIQWLLSDKKNRFSRNVTAIAKLLRKFT